MREFFGSGTESAGCALNFSCFMASSGCEEASEFGTEFDLDVAKLFPQVATRLYLRKVLRQYDIKFITSAMLARRLIELVHDPIHIQLFDICRNLVRTGDQIEFSQTLPAYDLNRVLRRQMERKYLTDDFGFRVCGGKDQQCDITISAVDRNGLAWKGGFRPGMRIVRINGMRVNKATHRIFVDYVRIALCLDLEVKMIGMIPKLTKTGAIRWHFAQWKENASPKPTRSRFLSKLIVPDEVRFLFPFVKELPVLLPDTTKMSLGIRVRQIEHGLRVISVIADSVSATAKIQTGDVIVEANEKRLENRDLEESLAFLQVDGPFTVKIIREEKYGTAPFRHG